MTEAMKAVAAKPCQCVSCPECHGSGHVWFAFPGPDRGGKYLGDHRCDDLDELELCFHCGGSGITETCDRCQEMEDLDQYDDR